jgi:peptidyl-prolyl cis-trans isomerase D
MAKQKSQKELSKKHIAHSQRAERQQRWIILGLSLVGVLVVLLLVYGYIDQTYLQDLKPAARVGSEKITVQDFKNQAQLARLETVQEYNYNQAMLQYAQQTGSYNIYIQAYYNLQQIQSQLSDASIFASNYLDSMIENVFLRQQAGKMTPPVTVSDADVDQALQKLFAFYPNGTPTAQPTSTTWVTPTYSRTQVAILGPTYTPTTTPTEAPTEPATSTPTQEPSPTGLAATATPAITLGPAGTPTAYTLEGYKALFNDYLISLKPYNLTEKDLREYWKNQLLQQKMYEAITADVSSSADQVWARHILVASEAEAQAVINRLKSGEDWSTIAADVSIDTATKSNGGDLDWFPKGVMVKEFEDAAFSMKVGETSQPVKTSMGYHIIQVLGQENRPLSSQYLNAAKQKIYNDWLDKLKTGVTITKNDIWKNYIPTQPTINTAASQ